MKTRAPHLLGMPEAGRSAIAVALHARRVCDAQLRFHGRQGPVIQRCVNNHSGSTGTQRQNAEEPWRRLVPPDSARPGRAPHAVSAPGSERTAATGPWSESQSSAAWMVQLVTIASGARRWSTQ